MTRLIGLLSAAALAVSLPVAAQDDGEASNERTAPDFSEVTSRADVRQLVETGELVPIYLFPLSLGGPDMEPNIVHVTPEAAEAKALIDGTIEQMVADGQLDQMDVRPEYRGDSFVPSRIVVEAWNSQGEGRFEPTIEVW